MGFLNPRKFREALFNAKTLYATIPATANGVSCTYSFTDQPDGIVLQTLVMHRTL